MPTYSQNNSLGYRSNKEIAEYLALIGDAEGERELLAAGFSGQTGGLFTRKAYSHTGMIVGFVPQDDHSRDREILGASRITAQPELIGKPIKITLDKFHVASYPGLGKHTILCEFSGCNQAETKKEDLTFARRFDAADGAAAGVSGAPIFMGLNVSADGISFKGRTVNVRSSGDSKILETLDSPAFRGGLSLLHTAQPALIPFTNLTIAAVKQALTDKKNVQVHTFDLGLDFGEGRSSVRLRAGSYVVLQSDEGSRWKWDDFAWNDDGMAICYRHDQSTPIPFNYMVFSIDTMSAAKRWDISNC